ncbi:UNVERIFIED_CONTAM: hypothetical protein GTU68_060328 [Idotea baltica]|nr:hypothetical protein [Idotea baltica]
MFETMYNAQGVGLAAPQINMALRLFIDEPMKGFKRIFINPRKIEEVGEEWVFEEGCLSIPDIRENVRRKSDITLRYLDENFEEKTEFFTGLQARIIQHEYDHIEGVLFTDYISQLRKQMVKGRLNRISKGKIDATYPMKFYQRKG